MAELGQHREFRGRGRGGAVRGRVPAARRQGRLVDPDNEGEQPINRGIDGERQRQIRGDPRQRQFRGGPNDRNNQGGAVRDRIQPVRGQGRRGDPDNEGEQPINRGIDGERQGQIRGEPRQRQFRGGPNDRNNQGGALRDRVPPVRRQGRRGDMDNEGEQPIDRGIDGDRQGQIRGEPRQRQFGGGPNDRNNRGGFGRGAGRGRPERGPDTRPRFMGYRFLQELDTREPDNIIMTLYAPNSGLKEALTRSRNEPDRIKLLLSILAKACLSHNLPEMLLRVFNDTKEAEFFDIVLDYFLDLVADDMLIQPRELQKPLKDCIFMLKELSNQSPSNITQFLGIYSGLQDVIDSLRERPGDLVDSDILEGFMELRDQKEKLLRRIRRKNAMQNGEDRQEDEEPPGDFREIDIFPQTVDMQVDEKPFLRKNKVRGAYNDVQNYLDIQFRLLREDFIGPLRDGIGNYIQAVQERGSTKKLQDIRIYPNVQVISPVCGDSGICHVLHFDVSRLSKVRWQSTKRLIFGSLLCLSPDNFNSFYFATVSQRDPKQLEQGLIHVRFEHDQETTRSLFGKVFTMAETTAYFESYRHVLLGLKRTQPVDFPFEKYIVRCRSNEVEAPAYLRRRPDTKFDLRPLVDEDMKIVADTRLKNLGELVVGNKDYNFSRESRAARAVSLLQRDTWPPADLLKLDGSQFEAIHTALTREFVITQGPPGTGKTYIGLKIVKALLHNKDVWSKHPVTGDPDPRPMLIVCYTNHALDQFLEGIIRYYKGDILRVGGRSGSEVMKTHNLHNFRQRFRNAHKVPVAVFQGRRAAKDEMEGLRNRIDKTSAQIQTAMTMIIHEDFIQPFMGPHYQMLRQQFQQMIADYQEAKQFIGPKCSIIVEWLGLGNLAPLVEMEANLEPAGDFHIGMDEENQDPGDELIDVEEEVDALEAQRILEGADDDYDIQEILDEFSDLSLGAAVRKARELKLVREINDHKVKAVALDVGGLEKKPKGQEEGEWQQSKKQRKQMKRNIQRNLASAEVMTVEEARNVRDLWRMPPEEKWKLYRKWIWDYCSYLKNDIAEKETEFERAAALYREALMQEDKEIMRQATVIGMTTTGAARYQSVLQDIRPRIIVVEEAAEVLEAHIITTLSRGCEHLILIGDHKQLRPSPTVYKLAKDYNLDVSLFERMISNGLQYDQLCLQHRMRPEIAELMHHIYKNLRDHDDVKHYDNVKGIAKNMFFVNHKFHESHDDDLRSHSNEHEANYIVKLCRYLIHQGYDPSQITVLTTYSGQLFCLRNKMPKSEFDGVRVTVVDNFQGEENDIILLSLVRSNEDGHIGFLKVENRVCVALSRAKKGFYVVGNFDLLSTRSTLWKEITIDLKRKNRLGEALPLYCQNHPDDAGIQAKLPGDFDNAPEGGCSKKCEYRLKCGHVCSMFCHVTDKGHKEYVCRKRCERIICDNNHRCKKKCYQACGECEMLVTKTIPKCGHKQAVPCHLNPEKFVCMENCRKLLECGHRCRSSCGTTCSRHCTEIEEHRFPCGHSQRIQCHQRNRAVCPKPCEAVLNCEHICTGTCGTCVQGRLHQQCRKDCRRILVCGHICKDKCNNCPPCTNECENRCYHSRCRRRCGELCVPCIEPCRWRCEHYRCNKLCSEPCDRERCNEPCMKRLPCGHMCIGLCGEPCPNDCRVCDKEKVTMILFGDEDEPDARFVLLEDCRHIVEYKALDRIMDEIDEEGDHTVQLKVCPICKTPIRKSYRYGAIINKTLRDVEQVKRTLLLSKTRIRELEREIMNAIEDGEGVPKRLFKRRLETMQDPKSEGSLASLQNQIAFLNAASSLAKDWEKVSAMPLLEDKRQSLAQHELFVKWAVEDRSLMTLQESKDAEMELRRMKDKFKLAFSSQKILEYKKTLDVKLKREMQVAERLLANIYTEEAAGIVKRCLEKLEDIINVKGLGISQEEKLMIVSAMGLPKGHWFKCKNGHYYAIGDCGGATMESRCPTCNETIGGGQHRLRGDNYFAGEMDGAARPAWPGMGMANLP